MAINKQKRKKLEETVYGFFDIMDKTGTNTMKYKELFSSMNDTEFDNYMKKFFKDEDRNFYLEITPYESEPSMDNINSAAKFLNIPLYEYVYIPFKSPTGKNVATRFKVPVGYIPIKRVQQMAAKKNTMSIHIEERGAKSGQVSGHDKNSRSSDVENISLICMGMTETMKEFIGPRSDDMFMKNEMLKRIKNDGYVDVDDIPSIKANKVALNTLDVFFLGCGLKTNLITEGLLLPRTIKNMNKDTTSLSSKHQIKESTDVQDYISPLTLEQIREQYGLNAYEKIKQDPLRSWIAETGITVLYNGCGDIDKIMENWNRMSDIEKVISDNKCLEFFGITNIELYHNIKEE